MDASWIKTAQWIWAPNYRDEDTHLGRYFLFRKTFQWSARDAVKEFPVHVSADTRYRLFVNGQRVSFGPCKSYKERWYYETVDILSYLRDGENVISARVLRYSALEPGSSSIIRTELPGLIVHGDIEVRVLTVFSTQFTANIIDLSHAGFIRFDRYNMEVFGRNLSTDHPVFGVELHSRTTLPIKPGENDGGT